MEKLLSFVRSENTVNYTLAGYVSTIMSTLFAKNPTHLFQYLETHGYIPCLLSHIYCNAFAEILSKMILLEDKEYDTKVELLGCRIDILNELVKIIHQEENFEKI